MNRFVVCGAPCAGKSTFVAENAQAGDLIYDYDLIHSALSGRASHDHLNEIRPFVIAARDAVFAQLEAHPSQRAWIITSSPRKAEIIALAERFGAEIEFLEVSRDEAHSRADIDSRPGEWHDYIENWFQNSDIDADLIGSKSRRNEKIMKQKTFKAAFQIKENGEEGEVEAVFATLDVIDHDKDITIPGAFSAQEVIIEPWNHGWQLPAGKGIIREENGVAVLDGRFFIDTETGLENYKTVKNMGSLAEWSYTFNVLDQEPGVMDGEPVNYLKRLDVIGVSPVTRGAGLGTGTRLIKSGGESRNAETDQDESESAERGKLRESLNAKIGMIELTYKINSLEA